VLADAAHRCRKRPGWQAFKNTCSAGDLPKADYHVSIDVEGDIVADGEPAGERTYPGPSTITFHRDADGHWFLTTVALRNLSLTSEVSIDLSQFSRVQSLPSRAPANLAVQFTKASDEAALVEWLAARYPLGDDLMKDPGGTVEVLSLQGHGASIRLDKVPYHRLRDGGRHEYSGPGSAEFSGNGGGQWALRGVWLSELKLWGDIPAQWTDSPDHGVLVR
jgi:hypothetical protein